MIKVKCPNTNRVQEFEGNKLVSTREEVEPIDLMVGLYKRGWLWEIDFSQATEEENFIWGRADLVARCLRALDLGRPVIFLGKEYHGLEEAGQLEDDIVASGRMVRVKHDDQRGVVIGTNYTQ